MTTRLLIIDVYHKAFITYSDVVSLAELGADENQWNSLIIKKSKQIYLIYIDSKK